MTLILASIAALYATGAVVVALGIRSAPEAFEDETGFHVVWHNNRPDLANVACVWETQQLAMA